MNNKLLIFITLFISSFFFLFNENVKADSYTDLDYNVDVNSVITDDFLELRKNVINYANENKYNYIIYSGFAYFTNISDFTGLQNWNNIPIVESCRINGTSLGSCTSSSSVSISGFNIKSILDSTVNLYYSGDFKRIKYLEKEYLIDNVNPCPSVYKIYMDINNIPTDEEQQKNIVSDFYLITISKLEYLSSVFIDNYIFLVIITIFILIFIFKLIFRRLL